MNELDILNNIFASCRLTCCYQVKNIYIGMRECNYLILPPHESTVCTPVKSDLETRTCSP